MRQFSRSRFNREYSKNYPKVNLWVKRVYVITFNIYAWYWLYREIFINLNDTFEGYLLWFFTVAGMHFFVFENQDLWFTKRKATQTHGK